MIARDRYLMRLVKAMWDGEVKVITGPLYGAEKDKAYLIIDRDIISHAD